MGNVSMIENEKLEILRKLFNFGNFDISLLPKDFFDNNLDVLPWRKICSLQNLSEEFMETYKDRIFWADIARYQKLSHLFILKMRNYFYWGADDFYDLSKCQKLSKILIELFCNRLYFNLIPVIYIDKNNERSWKTFL